MAIAYTESLPAPAAKRVIPGLCRLAIEAACVETVRRRRLARGEKHADVEDLLAACSTTRSYAALAIFDDAERAGDVHAAARQGVERVGRAFPRAQRGRPRRDGVGLSRRDRPALREARAVDPGAEVSTPTEVLAMARQLLDRASPETAGLWPRRGGAARAVRPWRWRSTSSGPHAASRSSPARRASSSSACASTWTITIWPAASTTRGTRSAEACHHHPYELAPTVAELRSWLIVVGAVAQAGVETGSVDRLDG